MAIIMDPGGPMKNLPVALLIAAAVFLVAFFPRAEAQMPARTVLETACAPGRDSQLPGDENYPGGLSVRGGGLTPQHILGATTVSVREAKCIIDRFGAKVLVLAAMNDGDKLPGAIDASSAANADAALQPRFAAALAEIAGSDKSRPIVVYCHHERCFLSYNVALRTAQAGYTNVFWMRPGIVGWKAAGYPVEGPPPPPGAVEVSSRLKSEIARCRENDLDYKPSDWASMLTQIPSQAEQDKAFVRDRDEKAKWFKLCLSNIARSSTGAADKAEADRAVAAADAEVTAMFEAARRDVEANPAQFLTMTWDAHRPAQLRADLAALRAVTTLEQACGTIDFSQPALTGSEDNNRYIASLNERRKQHGTCIRAYYDDSRPINKTFGLESANKWVHATRRFTCGANASRANCIADEPFNTIASIATDANVALAKKQDKLFWDQRARVGGLIEAGNAWIDEVNRRIGQFNAGY